MNRKKIIFILLITINLHVIAQSPVRYVALGDSYTIGTGAKEKQAWPELLTQHLGNNKINIHLIANPSHNGWTSQNLIDWELPILDTSAPDFVTLLIGVNDWVQGVNADVFRKNLVRIIEHIQLQLADKSKLILITIPDFGVTPAGSGYSNGRDISKGITEFNKIIISEGNKRNLKTVDIFAVSKEMKTNADLIASDGLHPSAKEYAKWETLIYPVALELLK